MKVNISKDSRGAYMADPVELPGMPPVGKGNSLLEAMRDFMAHYHKQIGLEIEIDASAAEAAAQENLEVATARAAFNFGHEA